jgi:hypothetical protein
MLKPSFIELNPIPCRGVKSHPVTWRSIIYLALGLGSRGGYVLKRTPVERGFEVRLSGRRTPQSCRATPRSGRSGAAAQRGGGAAPGGGTRRALDGAFVPLR